MATTVLQVCLTVLLSILCTTRTLAIEKYTMEDYCGGTIDMSVSSNYFKLQLTRKKHYDHDMDCRLLIRAPYKLSSQRLYVQFLDMEVDCSDHLQFYDGPSTSSKKLGYQMCGDDKPNAFVTSGQDLYIRFRSDHRDRDDGFKLLINSFHTGFCSSSEFSCQNGRCIDNDLYCDDYDNCGDDSDSCYKNFNWWIWMVVGIVVFLVVCIIITVACCCLCKRSRPATVMKRNNQQVVHYQSGTNTVTPSQSNPWYGTPTQLTQSPPMVTHLPTQATCPPGQAPYQDPPMPQPPPYTPVDGSSAYPPSHSAAFGWDSPPMAPPPYSEKEQK